jgi:hypothetical protein
MCFLGNKLLCGKWPQKSAGFYNKKAVFRNKMAFEIHTPGNLAKNLKIPRIFTQESLL